MIYTHARAQIHLQAENDAYERAAVTLEEHMSALAHDRTF